MTRQEAEAALRIAQLAVDEAHVAYFLSVNVREKTMSRAHYEAGLSVRQVAKAVGMDYRNAIRAMRRYRAKTEPDRDSGTRALDHL